MAFINCKTTCNGNELVGLFDLENLIEAVLISNPKLDMLPIDLGYILDGLYMELNTTPTLDLDVVMDNIKDSIFSFATSD